MADRSVVVRLKAEVAGFKANMASARKSLDDLTKADVKKPGEAFESMANKAAIGGAVLAVGVGKAVKSFADFDSAMSAAGAATNTAKEGMQDLRDLAIEMGADTQFSATEAAEGITEMAKAGVDASDILNGGLKGGLDLAAAGQLDVARASEIAATALTQFNLQGSDVAHVADLYAAAAGKAQGSVEDIAQAMKFAGVTAASMNISIEETTGVIGLFASKGIIGEQAGTSFRSMLLSLTAPSAAAAEKMSELGINVFDASGNFIGMQGAAQQLTDRLGPLDEKTRQAALGQIFGNESINAAIALYESGARGVAEWTDKVNDAGFAAEQAAKLTDNLNGDLERLGGSIDTVFIQAGSGANDAMRTLVQTLGGVVDYIGKIPGPILLAGTALGALALLAPKGILMWRDYTKQLDTLGISFDKLSKKAPRTAKGLSAVGKAAGLFGIAATAVYAFGDAADSLNVDKLAVDLETTSDGLALINKELAATTNNGWGRVGSDIDSFGKALGAAFDPGVINSIDNAIGGFKTIFGGENVSNIANASKQLAGIDQALAQMVASGNGDRAAALWKQMTDEAARQGISVEELERKFPGYAAALARAGGEAKSAAGDTGLMSEAAEELEGAATKAEEALDALQDAILGLGDPVLRQRAATRDYEEAIDNAAEGLKEYKDKLVEQRLEALGITDATDAQRKAAEKWAAQQMKNTDLLDENTEAGRKNSANLDAIAESAKEKAAADFAAIEKTQGLEAAQKAASEALKKGREDFINAAVAAGMERDEAEKLADQLELIPENIDILVKQTGAEAAAAQIDQAARNRTATITVRTKDGGSYRYTTGQGQTSRPKYGGGFTEYETGGYTGAISPKAVAGVVHGDEHVISSPSRRKFEALNPGVLDYINRYGEMPRGYADGGRVGASFPVSVMAPAGPGIDYDRLGRAVAQYVSPMNVTSGNDARAAVDRFQRRREWEITNNV